MTGLQLDIWDTVPDCLLGSEDGGAITTGAVPVPKSQRPEISAEEALGTSRYGYRELEKLGVIKRQGKWFVFPLDMTGQRAFDDWIRSAPLLGSVFAFKSYRRTRDLLHLQFQEHPDWAYLQLGKYLGRRPSYDEVRQFLGSKCPGIDAALDRLFGKSRKSRKKARKGTLKDLLNILPSRTRAAFKRGLDTRPLAKKRTIQASQIGRAMAIDDTSLRLMAACMLLYAGINGLSRAVARQALKWLELLEDLFDGGALTEDLVADRLAALAEGRALEYLTVGIRKETVEGFNQMLSNCRKVCDDVLGKRAGVILDLLPRRHGSMRPLKALMREHVREALDQGLLERTKRIENLLETSLLEGAENFVGSTHSVLEAFLEQLAACREQRVVAHDFPCRVPVIRPNGTFGTGWQIVRMRLVRESELIAEAFARKPGNAFLNGRLPPDPSYGLAARGRQHKADAWNERYHLVYLGTRPEIPGGECHEPFWVDLFRYQMLDKAAAVMDSVATERVRRKQILGIPESLSMPDGLLTASKRDRRLHHELRGPEIDDGPLVIPMVPFYHAMLDALLLLRLCMCSGARFSEALQLRSGSAGTHPVGGIDTPCLELKPKGWLDYGKFALDADTTDVMRAAKTLRIDRWFGNVLDEDGEPNLPVRQFGDQSRRDVIDPARFYFVNAKRAVYPQELTFFVDVLCGRITEWEPHDGRRQLATVLGLNGHDYDETGVLLHHRPGSRITSTYNYAGALLALQRASEASSREGR